MRCEVCGRKIFGTPHRVMIEGAKMTVCNKCAKLGSGTWEIKPSRPLHKPPSVSKSPFPRASFQAKSFSPKMTELQIELVEDFSARVRKAREKLGWSHEDLGKKINEKVSVLKKIEAGKMTPDMKLAMKLEHVLKIKLITPLAEPKPHPTYKKTTVHELTLGDLINFKEEKTEDEKKREQS
mgnify:CR=1 FL=1